MDTQREKEYTRSEREREESGDNVGGWREDVLGGTTCCELEIDRTWSVAAHCGGGR
jgi:hypothetical protein